MVVFPIVIISSLVLYVYYKVAITRSNDGLSQAFMNAKARICLGTFISFFGINQYLFYETSISLYITIIFVVLGLLQLSGGVKRVIHYANEFKKREQAQ